MLQKCEHSPVVVKKTQIVFCPGAEPTNPESVCVSLFYVIDTGSIKAPGPDPRGTEMGVTYLPPPLAQTLTMPIYPYPYWVPQSTSGLW